MKLLNLGSLNIDRTYTVEQFVREGQTINAARCTKSCGGKGLNQSVAAARAGLEVWHAGMIGQDGAPLRRTLEESGVHTEFLAEIPGESGHAVIQLDAQGRNCIICWGGANHAVDAAYIDRVLERFGPGDLLLLQNETTGVARAMERAAQKGMKVAFNPSPITPGLREYPLQAVDVFLLNETEGEALTGCTDPEEILAAMHRLYPKAAIVLTLGAQGAVLLQQGQTCRQAVFRVPVADTTAAGDTFCGYFLAGLAEGLTPRRTLALAGAAAALAVSRPGAADSIPLRAQVEDFLNAQN